MTTSAERSPAPPLPSRRRARIQPAPPGRDAADGKPTAALSVSGGDTRAAEARLREIAVEASRRFDRVWSDGTGRRDDATICRPDGTWIGVRLPGAGPDVRTLSTPNFKVLWQELSAGSRPFPSSSPYDGHWIETRDGGIVGLRNSRGAGWTIDLQRGSFFGAPRDRMKFHNRRALEEKAMMKLIHLEVMGYEFIVDSKPMWEFEGAAYRLTDDPALRRAFVRECVLTMLAAGAYPYEHHDDFPYGEDTRRWQGLSPAAIADDIVEATFSAPDIFDANIWWNSPWAKSTGQS